MALYVGANVFEKDCHGQKSLVKRIDLCVML